MVAILHLIQHLQQSAVAVAVDMDGVEELAVVQENKEEAAVALEKPITRQPRPLLHKELLRTQLLMEIAVEARDGRAVSKRVPEVAAQAQSAHLQMRLNKITSLEMAEMELQIP
jgi:hypothetical protein